MDRDYGGADGATLRDAWAGPSAQHISYGTVEADTPGAPSVSFASSVGPLVSVRLHPSDRTVRCRVASFVAGNGEGEWHPFVGGDEVIVGIPEGNTRAGCVILGRLNNGKDAWPSTVAGQDATKNATSFRRLVPPYALELGAGLIFRQPLTRAQLALDDAGHWVLADSAGDAIFANAQGIGLQGSDGSFVQIDTSKSQVHLNGGGADLVLDGKATKFATQGTLSLGTSAMSPGQHAVTLEQVLGLLINFVYLLSGSSGSSTLATDLAKPNKLLDVNTFPAGWIQALTTLLGPSGVSGVAPVTAAAGGGEYTQLTLPLLLLAGLAVPTLHGLDQAIPLPVPFAPGLGRAGLNY